MATQATMDLKQLRALVAVADAGSVTRAATLLNLVQPAVTRQLQVLESELGTPLFDRGRSGMQLTEAGTRLVGYARRILEEVARAPPRGMRRRGGNWRSPSSPPAWRSTARAARCC